MNLFSSIFYSIFRNECEEAEKEKAIKFQECDGRLCSIIQNSINMFFLVSRLKKIKKCIIERYCHSVRTIHNLKK